ncbi:MAG: VWA domain-containing protein [Vicinamibacterales bacterium]
MSWRPTSAATALAGVAWWPVAATLASVAGLGAVIGATPPAAPAQQVAAQNPQDRPVFRGGANFVYVDAYPRNRDGSVTALTRDDFEILEDGVPQTLDTFEFVQVPTFADDARRDPSSVDDGWRQAADPHSRLFLIYLNPVRITREGLEHARRPVVQFLQRAIGPRDLFALLTPDMTFDELTWSRSTLSAEDEIARFWARQIDDAISPGYEPRSRHEQFIYDCFIGRTGNPEQNEGIVSALVALWRKELMLQTLRTVTDGVASVRDQRWTILLVTGGFTMDAQPSLRRWAWGEVPKPEQGVSGLLTLASRRQPLAPGNMAACDGELFRLAENDYRTMTTELIDAAKRHNVVIHVFDPSGMSVLDGGFDYVRRFYEWPRALADNTGGESILAAAEGEQILQRVARDLSSYYLLGYYSTNGSFDGKYRRIQVRVKPEGVSITARRGYLAPTDADRRAAEAATAAPAAAAPMPAPPSAAAEALARLAGLAGRDLTARVVLRDDTLVIAAELATRLAPTERDAGEIVVDLEGEGQPAGTRRMPVASGTRGVQMTWPVGSAPGPFRVQVHVETPAGGVSDRVDVTRDAGLSGAPLVFRATPSARSALIPVAAFQFRRTERLHVEWPPSDGDLDARVLGRDEAPLPLQVRMDRNGPGWDGRPATTVDVLLSSLATGDYVLELVSPSGGGGERRLIAFSVTR